MKLRILGLFSLLAGFAFSMAGCAAKAPTPPAAPTDTPTPAITGMPTNTLTATPSSTPTGAASSTPTSSATNTASVTPTTSPTVTATPTVTSTPTNSATAAPTGTATPTPTVTATTGPSWKVVGTAGFGPSAGAYFVNLIFNNDNPYVVYTDAGNSKGMVEEYTGGAWVTVAGGTDFTGGAVNGISGAFYNNNLYVAFADANQSDRLTVEEDVAGTWTTIGSAGVGQELSYTSIAFGPTGIPYVATGGSYGYLMEYTGAGTTGWVTVGGTAFSEGGAIFTSLAFDSSGNPYVAFGDSYYGGATLAEYVSSAWTDLGGAAAAGGGTSSHVSNYTSLAFNGGNPYVAYMDTSDNYLPNLTEWNGTSWGDVGTEGFGTTSGVKAYFTTLAFSPTNGNPYVSFSDENDTPSEAMVMEYTGAGATGWVTVGSGHFSAGSTNYNSLAFDTSGDPYVAYADENSNSRVTVMEYH